MRHGLLVLMLTVLLAEVITRSKARVGSRTRPTGGGSALRLGRRPCRIEALSTKLERHLPDTMT